MEATRQPQGRTTITYAIRVVNILTGVVIAGCALTVWGNLTGIAPVPYGDAWVPPESLPQVLALEIGSDSGGRTEITVLPLWLRALGVSSAVLMTVMLVVVFRAVHLLAWRSAEGRPFAEDVIRRLRQVSIWLMVLVVVRLLVDVATIAALTAWFQSEVIDAATPIGGSLGTDLPALSLSMVVAAAVAGVLAQAFRRGKELVEETDGLV